MNEDKNENAYGENHPKEEEKQPEPGIRERVAKNKGTDQDLEETRQRQANGQNTGGMGREETPTTETTQGSWSRPGSE